MKLSEKAERQSKPRPRANTGMSQEKSLAIIWPTAMRFCRFDGMGGTATIVFEHIERIDPTHMGTAHCSPHCLGVTTEPVN